MFSYYGSKSKIVHLYPKPKHGLVIEPFAGSARYSLLHFENDVKLYDLSNHVYEVWQYLLNASEKDILSLPDIPSKVSIDEYNLSNAEKYLIGFHLCRGKAKPRKVGHGQNSWKRDKVRIASNLYKIKHWKVFKKSYEDIDNQIATWFIDPPYRAVQLRPNNSDRYEYWKIDYNTLANFCQTRLGQVIVCEGDGADWLPFKHLTSIHTNTNNRNTKTVGEYLWTAD